MATPNHNVPSTVESAVTAVTVTPSPSVATGLRFRPIAPLRPSKDEVTDVLSPWENKLDEPPYTVGEMIAMVLVMLDLEPQTVQSIHLQILFRFKYYTFEALEEFTTQINGQERRGYDWRGDTAPHLAPILPSIYRTMKHFDLPLTRVPADEEDEDITKDKFTMSSDAARSYLRNVLEPPRQGTFDFMALPAELREKIYKMLLVYPKPGFTLADHRIWRGNECEYLHQLGLLSRDAVDVTAYPDSPDDQESSDTPEDEVPVERLNKMLAILSVSKQIHHEALPVFYGQNSFHFGSVGFFLMTLETMEPGTIQQITDVRVSMDYHGLYMQTPFGSWIVEQLSHLSPKKLMLVAKGRSDFYVRSFAKECGGSRLDEMTRLESLIALAKRAGHVEIRDDGFFGDLLREGIAKLEAEEGVED